jgi:flagellin
MGFSINTNVSALKANLYMNNANKNLERSLMALASGSALANAASNASGLAIADSMSAQVSGLGQAMMNINDSIGMIQTADGGLAGYNENLSRIRELTLQASNGVMGDSERQAIQKEIDQLVASSNDIANDTSFNDKKLLDGTGSFTFQTGPDQGNTQTVTIPDMNTASVLGTIDVTTDAGRATALDSIDSAMTQVNDTRATLGASQNRLSSTFNSVSLTQINQAAAESQIRDIDFALESANFSQQNLLTQTGAFAQAQSNASAYNVMRLLQ